MLNCTVTSQLAHFRFRRNRFCSEAVAPLRCTAVAQMAMMIMVLLVIKPQGRAVARATG